MARYIHEYSDSLVDNAMAEGRITPDDADILKIYLNGQATEMNNSATRYNTFFILVIFRQYIGEYRINTLDDLFAGVTKFKEAGRKTETVILYLEKLRQFYLWLSEQGCSSIPKDAISHKIKIRRPGRASDLADSILSIDDVSQLIRTCKRNRDRAFIALLYDAGIKTKEACTLKWKYLIFDDDGLYLKSRKKTKFPGNTRCMLAKEFLVTWRNEYPGEAGDDKFVFITEKGGPFTDQLAFRMLGRIAKESGISKPVQLHSLKQSKGLHHKTASKDDAMIKKMLWEIR
jgi:integrase/recombinase XerD